MVSSAADPNGTLSSYSWRQVLNTGDLAVTLNGANTSTPSFVAPEINSPLALTFELTVTDHPDDIDTDTVVITIQPHVVTANAGPNQTVNELDSSLNPTVVRLTGSSASDPNGTIASYQWRQVLNSGDQAVTLSNANTSTPNFTVPEISQQTQFTFELTVTEQQGDSGTGTVIVTVNPHVVTVNAGADQTVTLPFDPAAEPTVVRLSGSSTNDPTGNLATYSWKQVLATGDLAVSITGANTATPSFIAPDVNDTNGVTLTFELTVTENQGDFGSSSVEINILPFYSF